MSMEGTRFPNDCRVVLKNLVSKPENNGRQGFVKSFLEDVKKYQVQLLSGNMVKVKHDNLEVVEGKSRSRSRSRKEAAELEQMERAKPAIVPPLMFHTHPRMWASWIQQLRSESPQPFCGGIICFRAYAPDVQLGIVARSDLHVCVVEKAPKWTCGACTAEVYDTWETCTVCESPRPYASSRFRYATVPGPKGFPKGALEPIDQGCVLTNALRKWEQETGISRKYLYILPDIHFDDASNGTRLLAAILLASESEQKMPSAADREWKSPEARLRCRKSHVLEARRKSADCDRCFRRGAGVGVYLTCPMEGCEHNVCTSCQDANPVYFARWVPIEVARTELIEERSILLGRAVDALLPKLQPRPLESKHAPAEVGPVLS